MSGTERKFSTLKWRVRRRGVLRYVVSGAMALVIAVPMSLVSASVGSADHSNPVPTVFFGAPAVGGNGEYAMTIYSPAPFTMPPVSDGVTTDTFVFSISAPNTAGCSVNGDGSHFAYASVGTCVISATSHSSDGAILQSSDKGD